MSEVLDQIDKGIEHTAKIVDGVGDSQWSASTLCDGWDSRTLTNHIVGGFKMFTASIEEAPGQEGDVDHVGSDPKAAYHSAAAVAVKAWRGPDVLTRTLTLPFGAVPAETAAAIQYLEIFAHGLDLAVATGQESLIDQAMAEQTLAAARGMGLDNFRAPGIFGPEVRVADDSPAHARLLGYLGRNV